MQKLDRSKYNINSLGDFYGFLDTYLLSIDVKSLSFEEANRRLVFYISFISLYTNPPKYDVSAPCTSNNFSILLSANPEHIFYKSASMLVSSSLFTNITMKNFVISKLLSMLNLNLQLNNINLKIVIGFILLTLLKIGDSVLSDDELSSKDATNSTDGLENEGNTFKLSDIKMEEDKNGQNVNNLNESTLLTLRTYSSFKIFYKILYFNNFINFYQTRISIRANEISDSKKVEPPFEDSLDERVLVEFYDLEYTNILYTKNDDLDNIYFNSKFPKELLKDEQYYLKNCLPNERSILNFNSSKDIDLMLDSLTDNEIKNVDIVLQKLISNDSELQSILYQYSKLILSKVYMKLISNYLKVTTVTFNELIYVNIEFIYHFLLKNLSIFEGDDDELTGSNSSSLISRINSFKGNTVPDDELAQGIFQYEQYKKVLKEKNRSRELQLSDFKYELILVLNEQYMVTRHNQESLKNDYNPIIMSKLYQYKYLKIIQLKSEINVLLRKKLAINEQLEETYKIRYQEELETLALLEQEKLYYDNVEYSIDIDDLYSKVAFLFKDDFDKLTIYENNYRQSLESFKDNSFLQNACLDEFWGILLKDMSLVGIEKSGDILSNYLSLLRSETLAIIRPNIHNSIFCCLVGANKYFLKNLGESVERYTNFVSFFIFSFNRETNNCNKILSLKILYLILKEMQNNDNHKHKNKRSSIFTQCYNKSASTIDLYSDSLSDGTSTVDSINSELTSVSSLKNLVRDFYINDLKILVDIFIRELYNLSPDTQVTLINNYLRVFHLLLMHPQMDSLDLKKPNTYYKSNEIIELLLYLAGYDINELILQTDDHLIKNITDANNDAFESRVTSQNEETKKLARKCLSVKSLNIDMFIEDKKQLFLYASNTGSSETSVSSTSSFGYFPASGAAVAERMTLSKKLSNLRVSNNSTGSSVSSKLNNLVSVNMPLSPPVVQDVPRNRLTIGSPQLPSPVQDDCRNGYFDDLLQYNNGKPLKERLLLNEKSESDCLGFDFPKVPKPIFPSTKEMVAPPPPERRGSVASSPLSSPRLPVVPHNRPISRSGKLLKKPPPPPPPSALNSTVNSSVNSLSSTRSGSPSSFTSAKTNHLTVPAPIYKHNLSTGDLRQIRPSVPTPPISRKSRKG